MKKMMMKKLLNKKVSIAFAVALVMSSLLFSCNSINPRRSVVKLIGNGHKCSGEQVVVSSGHQYILTAGHCIVLANNLNTITVHTEDGRIIERSIIADDPNSDLLLLEGVPNLPALELANSDYPTEHVRTFTHGAGFETYKTEGELIEKHVIQIQMNLGVCVKDLPKYKNTIGALFPTCVFEAEFYITNARATHGSSGGLVVNDNNKLVGVISAGNDDFTLIVPIDSIHKFLDNY
jgi:S1-C subfamily serine protease